MTSITTVSQLGARASLAKLHVESLLRSALESGVTVNHCFYIVDPANEKVAELGEELSSKHQVFHRENNDVTPFGRRGVPPFGGDFNYDYVLKRGEIGDVFITLHDDSILYNGRIFPRVLSNVDQNPFGGFLDQRAKSTYEDVYLDGTPLSDLRIGTWFLYGSHKKYSDAGYSLALYKNYWRWLINLRFRTTRITANKARIWLNGSFDLNIRARLDGHSFAIFDEIYPEALQEDLTHFEKFTGFFTARDMLKYSDTAGEVDAWAARLENLAKCNRHDQVVFDLEFMASMVNLLDRYDIKDPLLNGQVISDLKSTVKP